MKDYVVAITGASGAWYAQRVVRCLLEADVRVHLIVSPLGQRLLHDELDITQPSAQTLLGWEEPRLIMHAYHDVGSELASGSFSAAGMAIVPCSANTLGQIAGGIGSNLISRSAAVMLKERRRLVLVYREMPMSRIDLENALRVDAAGAIFCPANPGLYLRPQTVQDVVDMVAGKVLDLLDVPHTLNIRWKPPLHEPSTRPHEEG